MKRLMVTPFVLVGMLGILAVSEGGASAQIAPTLMELSTYGGLHAAAAQGSMDDIQSLSQAGSSG